jgi:hypothetical protein
VPGRERKSRREDGGYGNGRTGVEGGNGGVVECLSPQEKKRLKEEKIQEGLWTVDAKLWRLPSARRAGAAVVKETARFAFHSGGVGAATPADYGCKSEVAPHSPTSAKWVGCCVWEKNRRSITATRIAASKGAPSPG